MVYTLLIKRQIECQWCKRSSGNSKNENGIDKIWKMLGVGSRKKVFVKGEKGIYQSCGRLAMCAGARYGVQGRMR